jgi:DNA-binding NarL/FixJ family response regulator
MGETVVIVDDNDGFRARTRQLLESDGFEVIGEADGEASGLQAVTRLRPQVALLDVQLPDGDGFALAARLRTAAARTAVVITSTRDACDYASAVESCGALGFIAKSELSPEALRAVLEIRR